LNSNPTRILVVDDSALYRQSIQNVLRDCADVSVVGTAKNGVDALEKICKLDPDLLTLDVQMPDMNGIELLNEIRRRKLRPKSIMVSGFTSEGAQVTTDALLEGAFDFVLKPSGNNAEANRQSLKESLEQKISAFRESTARRKPQIRTTENRQTVSTYVTDVAQVAKSACRAVIIGTSTGGPTTLKNVLPKLPVGLPVPILIVQHMPSQYTRSLAQRLNEACPYEVVEASDMMEINAGQAYFAPGGKQMKLVRIDSRLRVRVTDDPPENGVRPSVDYLIRAASEVLNGAALAVILTGMGRDGLAGCQQLKQHGGFVFAQSQDDCIVYGMPKAVIDEGLADRILTSGKIAPAIVRHVKRSAGK
jgi:two-component system chemotaxis response regulator CheB